MSAQTHPDLTESRQPQLYAAYISTYLLALVAVSLRLLSRKRFSTAELWLDDFAICASLLVAGGNFIDMLIWVVRGVGRHIQVLGPGGIKHFYINLFVCEILYTIALCFTKFSILLFYHRLFGGTSIRVPLMILASMVAGWGIAVVITTIFQCSPVQGFWDKSTNPTCSVNVYAFFIGNAVPNIVTDWALLVLPIPYILHLHQNGAEKLGLCGIFLLGGFVCIISIVRLYIMATQLFHTQSTDVTWLFIGSSTWTAVEVNVGIVSACLPSLRPIYRKIIGAALSAQSGSVEHPAPDGSYHNMTKRRSHSQPYIGGSGPDRGEVRKDEIDIEVTPQASATISQMYHGRFDH